MADVALTIGDRTHVVACAAGGEARLAELGRMLDERWPIARRAAGSAGSERVMLLVALLLADDLDEARQAREAAPPPVDDGALAQLAERLESLAASLEQPAS